MSKHDYELLNEIERLLDTRQASGDKLLNDLADTVPRASANFQHTLENQLITQMKGDNPMPKNKRKPLSRRRWMTLRGLAAALVLMIVGFGIHTVNLNNMPPVASQNHIPLFSQGIQRGDTVCLQPHIPSRHATIPVYRHSTVDGNPLTHLEAGQAVTYVEQVTSQIQSPLGRTSHAIKIQFGNDNQMGYVNANDLESMIFFPCGDNIVQAVTTSLNFEYGGQVADMLDRATFLQMTRAGMDWVHLTVTFTPEDVQANVQTVVEALEIARRGNLNLLITAMGNPVEVFDEGYIDQYAQWVGELAGMGVDALEIWSEPNIDRNWIAHHLRGEEYVKLLRPAYTAIKQASPNTMVISAAPAPTVAEASFEGQIRNDDAFLQEIVASGGLNYLDCVGLHYVEGMVAPSLTEGDGRDNVRTRYFQTHLQTYNDIVDNQRPLCITELGYLSGEGQTLPPFFQWANETTNAQQAEWITSAIDIARNMGNIRLVSIYNMDMPYDEVMQGYGIVEKDGTCLTCERLQENLPEAPVATDEVIWENNENNPTQYVPVVITTHHMPVGAQLTEDRLFTALYPENIALELDITSQIHEVVGKTLLVEIQPFQPIPVEFAVEPIVGGDVVVPGGKVAVALPIDELPAISGEVVGGMPIEIRATLNTVEVDAEFQEIANANPESITETNVVLPAEIIYIGVSSNDAVQGMMMVAVDSNDAVILTWLMDAGVPFTIHPPSSDSSNDNNRLCQIRGIDNSPIPYRIEPASIAIVEGSLPSSNTYPVSEVDSYEGYTWYRIDTTIAGMNYFGWVRGDTVTEITPCPSAP